MELDEEQTDLIECLVSSITSETGRAIVGLSILQLCVKIVCPEQSVRLHKAGSGGANFAWKEGIPMRVLDNRFITPALREYGLLRLNADGFMMTRNLAENYPYSELYKAAIRGAKKEWAELIELMERDEIDAAAALKLAITLLYNTSQAFVEESDSCLDVVDRFIETLHSY